MLKKTFSVFGYSLAFAFFGIITFIGYDNLKKGLHDYKTFEGIIIEKGIRKSDKDSDVFAFSLKGLNENFAIYRMTKNYDDLDKHIKMGDKVRVYYSPSNSGDDNFNLDVTQVEIGGKIILNKSEKNTKYIIMLIAGILAQLYMVYAAYCIIKYGKFENIIPPIF